MGDDSAGRNIRQLCGDIFPAQKRLTSEELSARRNNVVRTAGESGQAARNEPTKFLIFRPDQQSRTPSLAAKCEPHRRPWSEKRCVRLVSHATARRAASLLVPGLRTRFPAQSRSAKPIHLSPRRWNGTECWPVCGWQGQTRASRPWSPAPGSRTNAAVGSAVWRFCKARRKSRQIARILQAWSWPDEVTRPSVSLGAPERLCRSRQFAAVGTQR